MISMGQLTTHVLDTADGVPAEGIAIRLYAIGDGRPLRVTTVTNSDGRTDGPLLEGDSLLSGEYELEFDVSAYFESRDTALGTPPFLGTVVIRFAVNADESYHVPLLVSPWSYSTYRGS